MDSFRLRGTCRGVQCIHTRIHTRMHVHTHMHVRTPKTPAMNKDAHRNLLLQFPYSPQALSSGPNPTHPNTQARAHRWMCVEP